MPVDLEYQVPVDLAIWWEPDNISMHSYIVDTMRFWLFLPVSFVSSGEIIIHTAEVDAWNQ